jgi:hypothetical protein
MDHSVTTPVQDPDDLASSLLVWHVICVPSASAR